MHVRTIIRVLSNLALAIARSVNYDCKDTMQIETYSYDRKSLYEPNNCKKRVVVQNELNLLLKIILQNTWT